MGFRREKMEAEEIAITRQFLCRRQTMGETLQLVASLEWIALGIIVFVKLRKWNKRFSELHDELLKTIREE